jgi:hypothetical protein
MRFRSRIPTLSLLAAVAVAGSLALAATSASAATAHPAKAAAAHSVKAESAVLNGVKRIPDTKGRILCSGDLCIQYDGSFANCSGAAVAAWAATYTRGGWFTLRIPSVGYSQRSPSETWKGGGPGFEFAVPLYPVTTYNVTFWTDNGRVSEGSVNFTINTC